MVPITNSDDSVDDELSFNLMMDSKFQSAPQYVRRLAEKEPSLDRIVRSKRSVGPPKRLTYTHGFQQVA